MYASVWDTDIASQRGSLDQQVVHSKECQNWPPKESPMRHGHCHLDDITLLIGRSPKKTFKGTPQRTSKRTPISCLKSQTLPARSDHLTNNWDSQRNFQRRAKIDLPRNPQWDTDIASPVDDWWDHLTNRWGNKCVTDCSLSGPEIFSNVELKGLWGESDVVSLRKALTND